MVFLNVVEPFKGESMIEKIESGNEEELTVYLRDGRIQKISISNLKGDGKEIKVTIEEREKGKVVQSEETE